MSKQFKVTVTAVDLDTGAETVEKECVLKNVFLMGDNTGEDDGFATMILNTSIMNIAMMLASSEKTIVDAVRLANVLLDMKKTKEDSFEAKLMNAIMGGE